MRTKIINEQLTDLFYNFIEMEDHIAANDRYADLNSSDMRFLSAQEMDGMIGLLAQMNSFLDSKRVEGTVSSRRKITGGELMAVTICDVAREAVVVKLFCNTCG